MVAYNTKCIAKVVVVDSEHQVLLLKRSMADDKGPGEWDLPGGNVDVGEDYAAAASRELSEEAGIKAALGQLHLVYTRTGKYAQGNRCWLFFIVEVESNTAVKLSHEHETMRWEPILSAMQESFFQEQELALQYIQQNILAG